MRFKRLILLLSVFTALGAAACRPVYIPHVWTRYVLSASLPDREIVFLTEWLGNGLGFINADGTGLTYVHLYYDPTFLDFDSVFFSSDKLPGFTYLTWSSDGRSLFTSTYGYPTATVIQATGNKATEYSLGDIAYVGDHVAYVSAIAGSRRAIFAGVKEKEGSVLAVVELDKDPVILLSSKSVDFTIGPHSFCGEDTLLFRRWSDEGNELVFYKLKDRTEKVLPMEGLGGGVIWHPSCSPTGQWAAYTAYDGIYLVRPDGSENKLVDIFYGEQPYMTQEIPAVSWSPDGEWIVYHKSECEEPTTCRFHPVIYKLNIETGERVMLVDGGLYPYWRQPAGQVGK